MTQAPFNPVTEEQSSFDPLTEELRGREDARTPAPQLKNKALEDEMLEHPRQRRFHKRFLFWGALLGSGVLLVLFCAVLLWSDRPQTLLTITPFALIPLSLLRATPVIILIFLFKSVFRPAANTDILDKKDIETFKDIVSIIKSVQP